MAAEDFFDQVPDPDDFENQWEPIPESKGYITLYDMSVQVRQILDLCDEMSDDGEMPVALADQLKELGLGTIEEVAAICQHREEMLANANALGEVIKRLENKKQILERKAERRKEYLKRCVELQGGDPIQTLTHRVWLQKSPPSADLDPTTIPEQLPTELQKVTVALDKKAALDWHKNGHPLPAGVIIRQDKHLRIR
jgi:hypothetical protein